MMNRLMVSTLMAASLLFAAQIEAQTARVRNDHPFIGTWSLEVPGTGCSETYIVRADGTSLVTSAAEVAETEFTVMDSPSHKGFYKLQHKISKTNGKKDCSGDISEVGKPMTHFLYFNDALDQFVMCMDEDLQRCIGPFVRASGRGI